jgi:hypothetical protein
LKPDGLYTTYWNFLGPSGSPQTIAFFADMDYCLIASLMDYEGPHMPKGSLGDSAMMRS